MSTAKRRSEGRSPLSIGAIGVVLIVMVAMSSFYATRLPYLNTSLSYNADFTEAAGLVPSSEVRVAGVKVGKVTAVDLHGDRVRVAFEVNDAWVGNQTSASIQIKTVLGQKYLALEPEGTDRLKPNAVITRTTAPYDVIEAFSDVSRQIGGDPNTGQKGIDTTQLATSFRTLSDAFSGTPDNIRSSLEGVSRLSETISSRDQELQKLLAATKTTSKILADKNEEFERLIRGAGQLLEELNNRQQAISKLLRSTTDLSKTLRGIVADNQAQIGPALDSLASVTDLLNKQNDNLRKSIRDLGPFYRLYANVLGNGRWFDQVLTNVLPPGLPRLDNGGRELGKSKLLNNGGTEAG